MSVWLLGMILIPFAGSVVNGLILSPRSVKRAGVIASFTAAASFVCAIYLSFQISPLSSGLSVRFSWFGLKSVALDWGLQFDSLSALFCLVVTGVGTIIHVYSIGYMAEDASPARFFSYLNLFLFSMLLLVCADNLPALFVGWEGVGLCSYLLIGYWYRDSKNVFAANKAFIFNRIGDVGFLLGTFLCFSMFHSMRFSEIVQAVNGANGLSVLSLNVLCLLLFVGATGKSAQIPLYTWLPDAMAGPTPVSALIHAATMVTAGIYLLVRLEPLFHAAVLTSYLVAAIGGATSVVGAVCACAQRDIKKVLAYSTVSQLGLMFLGLGAGAVLGSLFHLVTHAFFKALLFLAAGSVIHALHGQQDLLRMGGLKKSCPKTFATFLIGSLALAGLPPFSGFFSKDLLLHETLVGLPYPFGWLAFGTGLTVSFLTAFYIARLLALTFLGDSRHDATAHESSPIFTVPLFLLATLATVGGLVAFPEEWGLLPNWLHHWLSAFIPITASAPSAISSNAVMALSTLIAGAGFFLGIKKYSVPATLVEPGPASRLFVDETYDALVSTPFLAFSSLLSKVIETRFIEAASAWPGRICRAGGNAMSFLQSGAVQSYLLILLLGGIGVLWVTLKGFL